MQPASEATESPRGNLLTAYRNYAIDSPVILCPPSTLSFTSTAGDTPVVDWVRPLNATNPKAYDKCRAVIARLALLGRELRRPEADCLRGDIYALRVRLGSVNCSVLCFFHGRTVSVVAHGLTKKSAVPATDIKQAIARKAAFAASLSAHTFEGETNDA